MSSPFFSELKACQPGLVDMLPAGVKLKAIEDVMKNAGIEQPKPAVNDKKELAEFLQKTAVNIENVNVYTGLPPEYTDPLAFPGTEAQRSKGKRTSFRCRKRQTAQQNDL